MKKQLHLIPLPKNAKFFGGSLLVGRRKSQRPLASSQAVHLIFRSQWAKGKFAFTRPQNQVAIEKILKTAALKHHIRIYRYAISSNHIHIIFRARRRWLYRAFVCNITGQIAQRIMENMPFKDFLKKFRGEGFKIHKGQAFWEHRPFTRIINWGKDYIQTMAYVLRNTYEALGIVKYTERTDHYARWRLKTVAVVKITH